MPSLRVLVIDNSIFAQEKIARELVARLPKGSLVERATDIEDAASKIELFRPNIAVLNFSMALLHIKGEMLANYLTGHCGLPVVAFGKVQASKAAAKRMGAADYLLKPSDPAGLERFYAQMTETVQRAAGSGFTAAGDGMGSGEIVTREVWRASKSSAAPQPVLTRKPNPTLNRQPVHATESAPATVNQATPPPYRGGPVELIAIGSSTGGTEALSVVLHSLKPPLPPIVIVQHIPAMFSRLLAKRLDEECMLSIKEGASGDIVQRDNVYIAPGGKHMTVSRMGNKLVLDCSPGAPVHSCCPSVDVLFDTVANHVGDKALGVILTGMGRDGADGLSHMREMGAYTFGQDEASCVVYGMPKAAYEQGAVCEQLPLSHIAAAITRIARA